MQKIDDYSLIILSFASLLHVLETCTGSEQQGSAMCLSLVSSKVKEDGK